MVRQQPKSQISQMFIILNPNVWFMLHLMNRDV